MRDTWQALYDLSVDVIVNGHEHLYQRYFAGSQRESRSGERIVQFTVGTGGASLYGPVVTHRNSAKIISTFGVAKFTLNENAYTWEFLNIDKGGRPTSIGGVPLLIPAVRRDARHAATWDTGDRLGPSYVPFSAAHTPRDRTTPRT
jgi:hypothetical protein